MRLLHTRHTPLQLKEFGEDKIRTCEIEYAILSHRWGDDDTSFQDLINPNSNTENTKGYRKIQRFLAICAREGYDSAELSEAINSMFRWYQLADVCYAYLEDVQPNKNKDDLNKEVENSEWFQCGWTLQELIAPSNMVFLAADWTKIGEKHDLSGLISRITMIDEAKRISWASTRNTTRVEDMAYCLMGIFNEEVMKVSDDQSLFAWDASEFEGLNATGLLALTPVFFKNSKNIVPFRFLKNSSPFTSQFIRIRRNLQKHMAWGHLRFTEPSTIYARKICWGLEEAVIKPARATLIQGTEPVAAKSQHNLILLFDSGCRNRHRTGTGSTIQAMRHLISDTGDSQICCFDQTAADEVDSIEMRVMRAYKIWNTYLAWYLATSRGNRDMARSEFSRMTSLRSWNQGCTVTFLGLFDSVNMAPGCNLARGTSGRLKEEDLPSVLIHPALVVRHAVAIDEQHPALRPNLANEIAGCTHDFQELWFPGGHAVSNSPRP
ncbi:hypothetical protein BDV23DRAFT_176043 [Aspergillus alliaceus]|uniref:T6SS Phospholipase effector Tle1-like catalytic domain-containing protein n=1 Tax=Petromyces alliaceus TaxID=209559 RepID=A0A5N7BV34_PETAA|nr:hypothetical protein BDV23DRAFT_176043 [Aspergillus alliaceus]